MRGRVGALLAVAALVGPALLAGEGFLERDMGLVYAPVRAALQEAVTAGRFPGWYPYDALGQPFVGMTVSGLFHPLTWLALPFPVEFGLTLSVVVAFVLAAVGAAALGRAWWPEGWTAELFAVGWALSGYPASLSNNLLYLVALATIPWTLLAFERALARRSWRWLGVAVVLWASVALIGDALTFAMLSLPLALLAALRAPGEAGDAWRWLLALGLGAGGLAMVQLLPSLLTSPYAGSAQNTLESAVTWSVHPARLVEWLVGPLTAAAGDAAPELIRAAYRTPLGEEWAASVHLGLPFVVLALVGLSQPGWSRARAAALLAWLLVVALWMGAWTGAWRVVWDLLPAFRSFRFPEKLTPFVSLGVLAAAGAGFERLWRSCSLRQGLAVLGGSVILAAAAALLAGPFAEGLVAVDTGAEARALLAQALAQGSGLQAAALLIAAAARWRLPARLAAPLTVGAVACVLLVQGWATLRTSPATSVVERPEWASVVEQRVKGGAWGRFSSRACPAGLTGPAVAQRGCLSAAERWGLSSPGFYLPAWSSRIKAFDPDPHAYYRLVGTRYLLADPGQVTNRERYIRLLEVEPGVTLFEDRAARPRAWLARAVGVPNAAQAWQALSAPGRRSFSGEVVIEGTAQQISPEAWRAGQVSFVEDVPERQVLEVKAPADSVVVLNDAWYPGWAATVDGAAAEVVPVNVVLRGVLVPAGEHRVEFSWRQPGLVPGAAVSLATGLVLLGLALAAGRRMAR